MVAAGTCCGMGCQTHASETRSKGMALPGRHLLRHEKWERHVRKETGFRQNPRCPRDTDGRCLRRTMEDGTSYRDSKFRRITSAPRHRYAGQLIEEQTPPRTHTRTAQRPNSPLVFPPARQLSRPCGECALQELPEFAPRARSCLSDQRRAVIHFTLRSPIAWHHRGPVVRRITTAPRHRCAATAPCAMAWWGTRPFRVRRFGETRSVGHDIQSEAASVWLALTTSAGAAPRTPALSLRI